MRAAAIGALVLVAGLLAVPAHAQRFPFERDLDASGVVQLDVETERGRVEVVAGSRDRIVVRGEVTVRAGVTVPADAPALAKALAAEPPIVREGSALRLRPPTDARTRSAVTVRYSVTLPARIAVAVRSDSGAVAVAGTGAEVSIRTQSGAITVREIAGDASMASGSGAVSVDGARTLAVETQSGAVSVRGVAGPLRVRSASGAVDARLSGEGDVDVETGSSAITLQGVRGGLSASSRSGRVRVDGQPARTWRATTQSSAIDLRLAPPASVTLDARSRSGSVTVAGAPLVGQQQKHEAVGTLGGGGTDVHARTGSGAIRVVVADADESRR